MPDNHILIFDFDGVIVNTFDMCFSISQLLNPLLSAPEYRKHFEGNIFAVAGDKTKHMSNVSFSDHYSAKLPNHRPEDSMPQILTALHRTYPMVIVSSTSSEHIKSFLEAHGVADCFTEILGSDVDRSKVVKIQRVLKNYSILPQDALMITDTLGDMREAAECGVRCIGVTWGYHEKERLQKGNPFAIVDAPEQIPATIERYFSAPPATP